MTFGFAPRDASPAAVFRLHLLSFRHDVLVLNCPGNELFLLCLLRWLTPLRKTPLIVDDLILRLQPGTVNAVKRAVKSFLLRAVDLFVQLPKEGAEYERYFGVPRSKWKCVPWKVNNLERIMKAATADDAYVVAGGGSLRDYAALFEAARGTDVPFVVACSRSAKESLIDRACRGNVPPNVSFVLDASNERWVELFARSRVVVVPIAAHAIYAEGISTYLQGMALGKCVVVTECPASRGHLTNHRQAILVPPGDPAALRSAILEAWNDESLRKRIGENGRRHAVSLGGQEDFLKNVAEAALDFVSGRTAAGGRRSGSTAGAFMI